MDRQTLIDRVEAGEAFKYIFFWGHKAPATGVDSSCFSQWFPIGFDIEDVHYKTAEHYMMAGKARLFGDDERLAAILASDTPGKARALGRQVRGFVDERWKEARAEIVIGGNVAKFGQDDALRAYLLASTGRILVEASPLDRIWGIGLAADDHRATDPRQWDGLNLLGFSLMVARERLSNV